MTDFNPSAVARGIGKVVREPTISSGFLPGVDVTTCLPFVDVDYDLTFDDAIHDILLDEERIVAFTRAKTEPVSVFMAVELMKLTISLKVENGCLHI